MSFIPVQAVLFHLETFHLPLSTLLSPEQSLHPQDPLVLSTKRTFAVARKGEILTDAGSKGNNLNNAPKNGAVFIFLKYCAVNSTAL